MPPSGKAPHRALIELQLKMNGPVDDGGPIGSLITFRSASGRDVCSAGFNWSFSSRVSGPNRQLQAWCSGNHRDLVTEDLGRPSVDVYRGSIAIEHDRIIELTSQRVFEEDGWRNVHDGSEVEAASAKPLHRSRIGDIASYSGVTQNVQQVGGSEVRFVYRDYPEATRVIYDRRVIASVDWDLAAGMYAGGYVWLSPISGGALFRCRFSPGMDACGPMEKLAYPGGGAYAMAWDAGNVWVAGDGGRIWRVSGDQVVMEFDGQSLRTDGSPVRGEFYAFAFFGDSLIASHYPTGVMLQRLLTKSARWLPFGEIRKSRNESARFQTETEIQSLVQWGGELWAGVYPFGELWVVNADGHSTLAERLFPGSMRGSLLPFPYADRILAAIHGLERVPVPDACRYSGPRRKFRDWYLKNSLPPGVTTQTCLESFGLRSVADWSQRVTSLSVHQGHLYAATGNRLDHGYSRLRDGLFLSQRESENYGRVWRLSLPGRVSTAFGWPKAGGTRFTFTLAQDRTMTIRSGDGDILTLRDFPVEDVACVMPGAGPYGRTRHAVTIETSSWTECHTEERTNRT